MNNVLKKIGIGFGIFIGFIFLVLLITPLLFKGKIMDIAKTEINKMLTAEVNFSDLKLSFIRNFPNAYIALEDLSVIGTGDFEGETLVAFKRFSVTVDIVSVIGMKNIKVNSILLDRAEINGRILEDGRPNWDIMKSSEETETAEKTEKAAEESVAETQPDTEDSEGGMNLNVALKKFEIRKAKLSYRDELSKMEAIIDELNFILRGDMAKEIVDLNLKLDITGIDFWMDGIRFFNNAFIGFDSQVGADLKNMAFTVKDNKFNLNEIVLNFSGAAKLGDDIDIDLTFATDKTEFKSLLSLIPAIYMQDFSSLETSGSLTLSGNLKGIYNDQQMPSGTVSLIVDDAMFKYPALPKSVDNINIAINAFYDGVEFDNTTLDIDKFDFKLGGNPFTLGLHVKTPESDMQVAAKFAGKIDFSSIQDIVPLPDTTIKGLLDCDVSLEGRMSTLESEKYEDFKADGMVKITGVNLITPSFPMPILLNNLQLNFNPRRVDLAAFDAVVGSTDLSLNGSLENFIPFVFNRGTVHGNLNLKSNNINLNEFMGGEKDKEEKEEESGPLSVVEIPNNIDFTLNANIGNILFDKLSITNTVGIIIIRDGKLEMQRLAMNLLDGSMVLNGEYNTQNLKVPSVNLAMDIKQFNIPTAIASISMLEKILPNPQNFTGRVTANLNLFSILEHNMSPLLESIDSKGKLQTHSLQLKNSELFGTLATLTRNDSFRNPSLGNVDVGFEIKDGRLFIEPIKMKMGSTSMEISGDQGLDTSLNYKVTAAVPLTGIGQGATDLLGKIPGGSNIKELPITGNITGTPTNPKVSLSASDMTSSVTDAVIDTAKARVSAEVQKQIDTIMAEAQKQADNVKNTAKQSADKVRAEANTQARNIERQAANKSIIEQRAAKVAADKVRSEGEANAKKIEQEAANQANNILAAARKRADELSR